MCIRDSPTMYASILGLDFDQLSSSLMAVLMVANILAIVFAAIMDKIGKAHPAWSGEGNLLMESGQAVKEMCIRDSLLTEEESKKAPVGFKQMDAKGKGMEGLKFAIQVDPLDCLGCGVCVNAVSYTQLDVYKRQVYLLKDSI